MNDVVDDTDLDLLRNEAYADSSKLDDRRALYEYQDPRPDFFGWILDQIDWPPQGRALDVGCGPGSQLVRLVERAPELTLVGADLSTGMLAETIASVPSVSAVAIDACALPFATDCFDVVMANHMLYHVADLDRAAAELRRVIVEGGTLGAVTNSHEHLRELLDLLAQVAGRPRRILPSDRFNLEESGADLERHFSHVEVRHHVGQLVVPDVEPLVTYARSSRPLSGRGYDEEDWERLMRDFELAVAAVIQREGAMHITTHAGSFVCH